MMRITDLMQSNSLTRNLHRQNIELDTLQNQLSSGQRIQQPSDDPAAASHQMYFRSRLGELDQFERNIDDGRGRLNLADGKLESATDILHRVRELAVQAAHGTYQGDNAFELREVISREIDQHLRSLIEIGNSRDATGRFLFGGHVTDREPFEMLESSITGLDGIEIPEQITAVRYRGDIGQQMRELERGQYIDVNFPGNQALWGTNTTITGAVDTSDYVATTDQSFRINGVEIRIAAGDTVDDVIDKINNAPLELRGSKIGLDFLSLNTTAAHQPYLEDIGGGTVLRDLGLVSGTDPRPPNNYSETATVSGQSVFDVLIKFRNDLFAGDQLEIGGRDLGNIDEAINNLLRHRAELGAKQNRIDEHTSRVSWDKMYTQELLAKNEGIDYPETIMNLKWLENVHQHSLNVGARIIRPTLMDFLR